MIKVLLPFAISVCIVACGLIFLLLQIRKLRESLRVLRSENATEITFEDVEEICKAICDEQQQKMHKMQKEEQKESPPRAENKKKKKKQAAA